MAKYFINDSIEILEMESDIYVIKILKQLPKKKDLLEYHDILLKLYESHDKLSLIINLNKLTIWSACIFTGEIKFFDSIYDKTLKHVRSVAIIGKKSTNKIIEYYFKQYKQLIPYEFTTNLISALMFTKNNLNIEDTMVIDQ